MPPHRQPTVETDHSRSPCNSQKPSRSLKNSDFRSPTAGSYQAEHSSEWTEEEDSRRGSSPFRRQVFPGKNGKERAIESDTDEWEKVQSCAESSFSGQTYLHPRRLVEVGDEEAHSPRGKYTTSNSPHPLVEVWDRSPRDNDRHSGRHPSGHHGRSNPFSGPPSPYVFPPRQAPSSPSPSPPPRRVNRPQPAQFNNADDFRYAVKACDAMRREEADCHWRNVKASDQYIEDYCESMMAHGVDPARDKSWLKILRNQKARKVASEAAYQARWGEDLPMPQEHRSEAEPSRGRSHHHHHYFDDEDHTEAPSRRTASRSYDSFEEETQLPYSSSPPFQSSSGRGYDSWEEDDRKGKDPEHRRHRRPGRLGRY